MERRLARVGPVLSLAAAREVLGANPVYLNIDSQEQGEETATVMPAVALAAVLESFDKTADPETPITLAEIPAERLQAERIHLQASLHEAWLRFDRDGVEALIVERTTAPGIQRVYSGTSDGFSSPAALSAPIVTACLTIPTNAMWASVCPRGTRPGACC